jgi:hypothetical protein
MKKLNKRFISINDRLQQIIDMQIEEIHRGIFLIVNKTIVMKRTNKYWTAGVIGRNVSIIISSFYKNKHKFY